VISFQGYHRMISAALAALSYGRAWELARELVEAHGRSDPAATSVFRGLAFFPEALSSEAKVHEAFVWIKEEQVRGHMRRGHVRRATYAEAPMHACGGGAAWRRMRGVRVRMHGICGTRVGACAQQEHTRARGVSRRRGSARGRAWWKRFSGCDRVWGWFQRARILTNALPHCLSAWVRESEYESELGLSSKSGPPPQTLPTPCSSPSLAPAP
jgi:hypothetical protein